MSLPDFTLELYFAKYEFRAQYLLCCSDAESFTMKEVLSLCDEETKALWDNLALGYTEAPGHPILRTEIAKQYSPGLSSENVYCFAGAEEGIYACMRTLLTDKDHVVVVTPAYQSLVSIAAAAVRNEERNGAGVTTLDLEVEQQNNATATNSNMAGKENEIYPTSSRWCLNLQKLRQSIQPGKTKMLIMNFPHNPTGALLTKVEQQGVVKLCREFGLYLFFDEVYHGLERDEIQRLPAMCTVYEKAFSLGVMSKSLGMAGLRVGWLATQDKTALEKIAGYKHYLSICNSAPAEILSLMALRSKEKLLKRNNDLIEENLTLVKKFLESPKYGKYFEWVPPAAGCIGFMHFKGAGEAMAVVRGGKTITLMDLADKLVTDYGCLILPGIFFPASSSAEKGMNHKYAEYFRFGFGRKNFPECMEKFQQALDVILEG